MAAINNSSLFLFDGIKDRNWLNFYKKNNSILLHNHKNNKKMS